MSMLSQFGVDLNELAFAGKLDSFEAGPRILEVTQLMEHLLATRLLTGSSRPGSAICLMEKAMIDASPTPATGLRDLKNFVRRLESDVAEMQRNLKGLSDDWRKKELARLDAWIA